MMHKFLKYSLFSLLMTNSLSAAAFIPLPEEKALQEHFSEMSHEPGAVTFTPPTGWVLADPKALPPSVKIMVVGKGAHEYPPSINLAAEPFKGSLKEYLKIVKTINDNKNSDWRDLGTIHTEAGDASLSQVDIKSQWGLERLMHLILIKDGTAFILTAAALKDEFPNFYKDFFNSMRTLHINPIENAAIDSSNS